jgi:hypothetical protein
VIEWEGPGLTAADRASAASITATFDQLMAGDARCAAERRLGPHASVPVNAA